MNPIRIEKISALILAALSLLLIVSGVGTFNHFVARVSEAPNPAIAFWALVVIATLMALMLVLTPFMAGGTWMEGVRLDRIEAEKPEPMVYHGPPNLRVVR